jgi:hypothetical protein
LETSFSIGCVYEMSSSAEAEGGRYSCRSLERERETEKYKYVLTTSTVPLLKLFVPLNTQHADCR